MAWGGEVVELENPHLLLPTMAIIFSSKIVL